ncbi:hypothetical protein [Virgisporangium aurantiacum]|uniref:Uncharacterized protein n=1 Tax=Virgisporangium aurantiacum TaxID=175570 RepID=A0A8J3ZDH9_9ACTN|nr:hypothetical protein [Virgisporangium aurantiacum]GIJ62194.1 hypothetical protein Vau01_097100 [Virgisporangium aurantiacum]
MRRGLLFANIGWLTDLTATALSGGARLAGRFLDLFAGAVSDDSAKDLMA